MQEIYLLVQKAEKNHKITSKFQTDQSYYKDGFQIIYKGNYQVRTIAQLYQKYSDNFMKFLDGNFSFIIIDNIKGEIVFGQSKEGSNLFYKKEDGFFYITSDLQIGEQVLPGFLFKYNLERENIHAKIF
jgi:hypothetical protein